MLKFSKALSVRPKPRTVHGIEIRKQPTLAYIEAVERSSGLLLECAQEIFPGMKPKEMLEELIKLNEEGFRDILSRALSAIPRKALEILREIVGAPEEAWNQLSPFEHAEVIRAFWELNDLSGFFQIARSVAESRMKTGLKG